MSNANTEFISEDQKNKEKYVEELNNFKSKIREALSSSSPMSSFDIMYKNFYNGLKSNLQSIAQNGGKKRTIKKYKTKKHKQNIRKRKIRKHTLRKR